MSPVLSNKAVRLLLAFSVSIWMAGGCLFGCSNSAMGAGVGQEADSLTPAIVAGESCHAAQSHHCCDSQKPKDQKPKKKITSSARQLPGVPSFAPGPLGMMKDCPLVVNATAVTSKNSSHLPDPGRGPVSALPFIENKTEQSNPSLVVSFLPNRGPTHLRCCVFLI
jgi:hypothetical protein